MKITRILELFTELVGWFRIFISPCLIGLFAGAAVYSFQYNTFGLITGIIIAATGTVLGAFWATRIWKRKGTVNFLSSTAHLNDRYVLKAKSKNNNK